VNNSLPRSWELEGLFLDIQARFPGMPPPRVPKVGSPTTVDLLGDCWTEDSRTIGQLLDECSLAIRASPMKPPPSLTPDGDAKDEVSVEIVSQSERRVTIQEDQMMSIAKDLLQAAYVAVNEESFGAHAWRLLRPCFLDAKFKSNVVKIVEHLPNIAAHRHVGTLDLLLEAHELTLLHSGRPAEPVTVEGGTTLLDVLEKRKHLPVTNRGTFFLFERRIGLGRVAGVKSYHDALEQLLTEPGGGEGLKLQDLLLKLVGVAIDHQLRGR
jgi:hypothetical protein